MPEYITDVAKWKNYSFLNNVWKTYVEFDNTLKGDTNNHKYEGVCEPIVNKYGEEKFSHKEFCMKLVRNLGCYYSDPKYYNPNNDRCIILYNWIYNTKKKYKHSNEIITECFNDYIHLMSHVPGNHKCSYDSYINFYEEPIKMTILDIFNNNIQNIIIKLMGGYGNDNFSAQNFVCECVKLYKEMEKQYCTKKIGMDNKSVQTCQMLKSFKTTYMEYIYNKLVQNDNIPSLENVEDEYKRKCQKNQAMPVLSSEGDTAPESRPLTRSEDKNSLEPTSLIPPEGENQGSSMSSTVSTTLGTVAGASSILALLYKVNKGFHLNFSPGRNWIGSVFRGNRGNIPTNFYAEESNELLFNGMEPNDFNSYSIGYEAI